MKWPLFLVHCNAFGRCVPNEILVCSGCLWDEWELCFDDVFFIRITIRMFIYLTHIQYTLTWLKKWIWRPLLLTITVRSPGPPGQRFMMLEYRVLVSGISDAVDYPRTSASHTENCPTQRILLERVISWLSKHARFSGGFCWKKRIILSFP